MLSKSCVAGLWGVMGVAELRKTEFRVWWFGMRSRRSIEGGSLGGGICVSSDRCGGLSLGVIRLVDDLFHELEKEEDGKRR